MARRNRDGAGGDDSNRWLTTYGDAVTLLLAFFVMLYAISQVDVQKFQLLVSGFQDPFKNQSLVDGLLETGDGIVGQASPQTGSAGVERLDIIPETVNIGGGAEHEEKEKEKPDTVLTTTEELAEVREALIEELEANGIETEVGLALDSRGLVVSIATDEVLFPSGSPVLQPDGEALIGLIAPILNRFDNEIRVEGHTDTVPLDNNGYTNWNLSSDRALAVLRLLEVGYHLNPTRLSATGYGEHRPVASNETEGGRQANRRVELVIVAGEPPEPTGG